MTGKRDTTVIAVLGAGRMGRGIAQAFAFAGYPVLLLDLKERSPGEAQELGHSARAEIYGNLEALAELEAFDAALIDGVLKSVRFAPASDAAEALAGAHLAFECVPEVIDAKQAALAFAGRHLPPDAVLASTTSTFLSSELAKHTPRPRSFLNAHWLNPAYLIPWWNCRPTRKPPQRRWRCCVRRLPASERHRSCAHRRPAISCRVCKFW